MLGALKSWLPFAVLATFMAGSICVVAHQSLRLSANDPQIQLAGDWAETILSGNDPSRLNLGPFIDPNRSLSPFGIIYSQDGSIVASSVSAPSTMAQPDGVFSSLEASPNKEVRFTWQPESNERYATVIKKTTFQDQPYYVLAGRNLREVDQRIAKVVQFTILGWGLTLAGVAVAQHTQLIGGAIRKVGRRR